MLNIFVYLITSVLSDCPTVTTQENFDLASYISKPWYIQQQQELLYQPADKFYCVRARYELRDLPRWKNWFGYTINVFNQATDSEGNGNGESPLCAVQTDSNDPAKLGVAPCFIPQSFVGPYWIVAYNEEEGYALISGGQPTIETENGCKTGRLGRRSYNGGLWIFTRQSERDEALVQKVRGIAEAKGFDLTVLKDVDQSKDLCGW